ncbi:MAG: CHRD domain-containing protein, partial [Verrucomicrobiales bacterium]|nr:CHRD domain-containing protein [Verrucomicrobiales bacterium]
MKKMHMKRRGGVAPMLALAVMAGWVGQAEARDFRVNMIPNGSRFRCQNCHVSVNGGGTRTAFGNAVFSITGSSSRAFWTPTLAALDSDGDGTSNGSELGDPEGDGTAEAGHTVTNPGNATSKPPSNQAPQVAVTAPANGATLTVPAVTSLTATATDADGTVASVEFFVDGQSQGLLTAAPYAQTVELGLGTRALTARAVDDKGLVSTSSVVTVTVGAPEAPSLTTVSVAGGNAALAWTGGGGPFAVQGKAAVMDPWCAVSAVTPERTATVPAADPAGLFRVVDLAGQAAIPLTAVLGGAFERPTPVAGTGAGSATFKLSGNTLSFDIRYEGLSGTATLAHIHGPAGTDASAGVLVDLKPFNGGSFGVSGSLSGSVVLTAEQKAAVLSGRTYVNVHTEANKPGEIRGQILPVLHQAVLSGANERPTPVVSAGLGQGLFLLSGDQLSFNVSYSGLSGPATLAHIHGPADAANSAGVLINLAPFNGGAFGTSGSLVGTVTLTPDQLSAVASGLTYVNIHTDANKPGEVRGQILPCAAAIPFSVAMSGAAERPNAVTTTGVGGGILALEGDSLVFNLKYSGLSGPATLAHFHGPASASESTGVLIDLAPFNGGAFGVSGTLSGRVTLTAEQKGHFLSGRVYANVHTEAN